MKRKFIVCLPCVALSLFVSSCGEKKPAESSTSTSGEPSEAPKQELVESANPEMDKQVEKIKEIQKEQKVAPVKEEEVRDVAGFAKHLPKESEMYMNVQGLSGLISSMRDSEIGKLVAEMSKKEGDDIDEAMQSDDFQDFIKVAGEEVFISMGDGSAKSLKTLGDTYSIYYRLYYYILGKMMINAVEGEDDFENPEAMNQMIMEMVKPLLDEFLELENYSVPTVYAGFKVSSESDRAEFTKFLQEALVGVLDVNEENPEVKMFYEDSTDAYGGFKGVKIDYSKLLDALKDSPNKELEMMGISPEYMGKFTEKFKDFKVSLLVGNYEDYVIFYLGDSAASLKFTDEPTDSLLANEEMAFLKEYKGKEVVSVTYVSQEISQELDKVSTMMEDLSVGVTKFLLETESFGDTGEIQALLKKMAANGRKLERLTPPSRFGNVAYLEDGFKMDSFLGNDSGIYDLETKRKLATIAMRHDAVLSSSWVLHKENSELAVQNLEDFVNLAYQVTKLVVEHDIKDEEFQEFSDMFKMLDGQFSDNLVATWKAVRSGMSDGLGNEGALVMDLKGKMPRVPDVPTVVLENGKIPRLAMGYDVVDRSKLAESWGVIDSSSREIVAKLERLTNEKIDYKTPELAKKEGIDFWSYQLGVTSHEANLALGINDQMMFFNTSPAFVESFASDYDADGEQKRGGMDFKLRLAPVRSAAQEWMELYSEHGEAIEPSFSRADFEEAKVLLNEVLKVSEELDSVDFSMRNIDGEFRSFFHINKRN